MKISRLIALIIPLCTSGLLYAGTLEIQSRHLDTTFKRASDGRDAAALNSGLGLSFNHQLLNLSVDYRLRGDFDERAGDSDLSQVIKGSLRSRPLNELLQLNAAVHTESVVKNQGDSYRHRLSSELSREIPQLADINARYSVRLDKASPGAREKKTVDYGLQLEGELISGRLAWESGFSEHIRSIALREDSTRAFDFSSRYALVPELHLDLSAALKRHIRGVDTAATGFEELRYGAGISWELTRDYAFTFRVNRYNDSRIAEADVYGSGSILWTPPDPWQLELSYDDHLVDGLRGVMLRAEFNLGGG